MANDKKIRLLMGAKSNLGQFFVFGDFWFFVHGSPPPMVRIVQ